MFEHGFITFFVFEMREMLRLQIKQKVDFYKNVDDYVSDVSSKFSPNVILDNVANLVTYFGIFLALVSIICILDFLDLIKQLQTFNRKLVHCSTRIVQEIRLRWSYLVNFIYPV